MEYRVVEIKWGREGNFVGTPPITNKQPDITKALNRFARDGWLVANIHHEVGDNLRFSLVTLVKDNPASDQPAE